MATIALLTGSSRSAKSKQDAQAKLINFYSESANISDYLLLKHRDSTSGCHECKRLY